MLDRYFPGFQFREFKPSPWYTKPPKQEQTPDNPFRRSPSEVSYQDQVARLTQNQVRQIFTQGLESLAEEIGEPLSMRGRKLLFVRPADMRPHTTSERDALVDHYGEYILDSSIGDCKPNPDGTYTLRVVDKELPEDAFENRFSIIAHEFGHTIGGGFNEDPIYEELKAYAFQELFTNHLMGVRDITQPEEDHVHGLALFRFLQLREASIKPEAIISHLVSRPFGRFSPEDYRHSRQSGILLAAA